MINGFCEFDVTEMTRTIVHVVITCLALVLSICRTKKRIVETAFSWLCSGLVHGIGVLYVYHTHVLDLLGRKNTELDLLNRLEWRRRRRKNEVRHDEEGLGE